MMQMQKGMVNKMPEQANNKPNVTEVQEFDFELITHVGDPSKPSRDGSRSQRYMGAMEDNMTVIAAPIAPAYETDDEDSMNHRQLTPG